MLEYSVGSPWSPSWTPPQPCPSSLSLAVCRTVFSRDLPDLFSDTPLSSSRLPPYLSCESPRYFGEESGLQTSTLFTWVFGGVQTLDISSRSVTHRQGLCRCVIDPGTAYILEHLAVAQGLSCQRLYLRRLDSSSIGTTSTTPARHPRREIVTPTTSILLETVVRAVLMPFSTDRQDPKTTNRPVGQAPSL